MVVHAMQSLQYLALLKKASQLCIMIAITTWLVSVMPSDCWHFSAADNVLYMFIICTMVIYMYTHHSCEGATVTVLPSTAQ